MATEPKPSALSHLEGKISPELYRKLVTAQQKGSIQRTDDVLLSTPKKSRSTTPSDDQALTLTSSPAVSGTPGSPCSSTSLLGVKRKADFNDLNSFSKRTKAVSANGKKVFQPLGKLKLRSDHPVRAQQLPDVWKTILSYCPPKFLRSAWRIDKDTLWALNSHSNIWRMSRYEHYGFDMPDPPPTLDERALNTLLEGTKCQSCGDSSSGSAKSRTVYWNFPARKCSACFSKETIKVDTNFFNDPASRILGLQSTLGAEAWRWCQYSIPFAVKRGGSYKGSTTTADSPYLINRRSTRHYCENEIKKYKLEFLAFCEIDPSDTQLNVWHSPPPSNDDPVFPGNKSVKEIQAWGKARVEKAKVEFKPLEELEKFMANRKIEKASQNRTIKEARVEFFIRRGAESNPPLLPVALAASPAYHRSIVITRPHSEDCWKKLEAKIRQEQADEKTTKDKNWSVRSFYSSLPENFGHDAAATAAAAPNSSQTALSASANRSSLMRQQLPTTMSHVHAQYLIQQQQQLFGMPNPHSLLAQHQALQQAALQQALLQQQVQAAATHNNQANFQWGNLLNQPNSGSGLQLPPLTGQPQTNSLPPPPHQHGLPPPLMNGSGPALNHPQHQQPQQP